VYTQPAPGVMEPALPICPSMPEAQATNKHSKRGFHVVAGVISWVAMRMRPHNHRALDRAHPLDCCSRPCAQVHASSQLLHSHVAQLLMSLLMMNAALTRHRLMQDPDSRMYMLLQPCCYCNRRGGAFPAMSTTKPPTHGKPCP
jgi:hypothetical protein